MNSTEFRQIMDARIATLVAEGKHDEAAKLEIAREYFANPEFRAGLEQFAWDTRPN